ncbi:MAG TPA: hypothetical protein VKU88_06200 [Acidimicrobiales bacterium]|nr:hypothetical protein [Acidimicrobiales bacterium]
MPQSLAPSPARVAGRLVAAPRVDRIDAELCFDVASARAQGRATVHFRGGSVDGRPALDLRQEVTAVRLDGQDLSPADFAPVDLGGGPGAEMRVVDAVVEAGSRHRLEVAYDLGTPSSAGAEPIGWLDGGVRFDLWMSDLFPGRYLEMWVPAPLVHDRFTLGLRVRLEGTRRQHLLVANTAGIDAGSDGLTWSLVYPAHFTALSPMLVLAPADTLEVRRGSLSISGRNRSLGLFTARHRDTDADLAACEADLRAWLSYCAARYEPWVHGDTFWAVVWSAPRGMEYDGATTASVQSLEHEVFHSWFGRGVKPARAADGWIDEAWTVWSTSSQRHETPRFAAFELGLDEPPSELYPPHPWARHTPREAYTAGARLFAGLAHLLGGPDRLRAAMADWYRSNAGRLATTDGLAAHLRTWSDVDISPWWARYVHGRGR